MFMFLALDFKIDCNDNYTEFPLLNMFTYISVCVLYL